MPRSLPWRWLWCSAKLWPFMKVCDKWATTNAAAGGDAETHQGKKKTFSKQLFLLMSWIHTQMVSQWSCSADDFNFCIGSF